MRMIVIVIEHCSDLYYSLCGKGKGKGNVHSAGDIDHAKINRYVGF